jgi:hypothetical protein
MDPRNESSANYARIEELNIEDLKKQDGGYLYRYRYNGGGASQVWLASGRFGLHFSSF